MPIHLLPSETIGKIAAGEVVERPASVVKELLENAIDAGADRISVEIRGGGVDLIEVSDNGHGIEVDDLPLALQRHSTSKLAEFHDLDRLCTLGFRGEALPSIAAVSTLSIRSRAASAAVGADAVVDFGRLLSITATPLPIGTTVSVRELFGNVPARRKFLRQASTEAATVSRLVAAYAAAYPGIAVSYANDGRRVWGTDGHGDPIAAAAGALGEEVGQAGIAVEPLDESAAVPGVDVGGWVCAPTIHRSQRQHLLLFVNGRWIQNRQLAFAVEEAYHSLLMIGRHPVALLDIRVAPAAVDVNVHPAKSEVKFVDERAVFRAVQRATHAALAKTPRDDLPHMVFAKSPGGGDRQERFPMNAPSGRRELGDDAPGSAQSVSGRTLPVLRVLGQVGATYVIAEGPDGLYLIDQHAAHERVMYEKLLGQLQLNSVDRQPLLDPMIVELTETEAAVFERSADELRQIGFEIESFGERSIAVRAVPAIVAGVDIRERLRRILNELAEGGAGTSWLDSVAISAACHVSIRAGQPLSLAEMRELVSQLERTRHPRACGHGRPTMLLMSQHDLEKQFGRR